MKKLLIIVIIALAFFNCNRSSNNGQTIKNIETQFFEIPIGKAKNITTKGGVIIEIHENTFKSNASTIQLEVQEILTRADLIRSGVSTITKKGELLETGGMVNFTTSSDVQINPEAPIKVKVPSKGLDTEMKLYEAVQKDGEIVWSLRSDLENQPYFDRIAAGKQLFQEKCAACHSIDLRINATGPALGNVTERRSREWLYEFTRNSQRMIESGDSLALCQWYAWSPTVMSSFEDLTDDELKNIYDFIENETALKNLNDVDGFDCEAARTSALQADSIWQFIGYVTELTQFNYINIDKLINDENENTSKSVLPFVVKTDIPAKSVFIIFENRMSSMFFGQKNDEWLMFFIGDEESIVLPFGEPVKLVAISKDEKQVGVIRTTIQDTNEHTIKLKPLKGSLDEFIESL